VLCCLQTAELILSGKVPLHVLYITKLEVYMQYVLKLNK